MNTIKNKIAVVSKFNRSIRLNLVRKDTKKFIHVCAQTGRELFFESKTRLDAAVLVASRYATHQSYSEVAYVNPHVIARHHGFNAAFELLTACGFVRVVNKEAVIVTNHKVESNQ